MFKRKKKEPTSIKVDDFPTPPATLYVLMDKWGNPAYVTTTKAFAEKQQAMMRWDFGAPIRIITYYSQQLQPVYFGGGGGGVTFTR